MSHDPVPGLPAVKIDPAFDAALKSLVTDRIRSGQASDECMASLIASLCDVLTSCVVIGSRGDPSTIQDSIYRVEGFLTEFSVLKRNEALAMADRLRDGDKK